MNALVLELKLKRECPLHRSPAMPTRAVELALYAFNLFLATVPVSFAL